MDNSLEAGSPPPAQLVENPRQLPSLPAEILQRIIQLALPRLSFKTFRDRYDILLNLCRVNKLWAALAQSELVKHAGFSSISHMQRYKSAQVVQHAVNRSKWLAWDSDDSLSVAEMLTVNNGLTALCHTSKLSHINLDMLALASAAPELQVLAIDFFRITGDRSLNLSFACIRHLALSCPSHAGELSTFLQCAELPLFEDLALAVNGIDGDVTQEQLDLLGESVCGHGAKVKRFSFAVEDSPRYSNRRTLFLPPGVWPAFTALEHLVLDKEAPVDTIFSLPTRLTTFRLRSPFDQRDKPKLDGLLQALRSRTRSLEALDELILPSYKASDAGSEVEVELIELCGERGIKITRRWLLAPKDYAAHLEDSLDF